MIIIGLLIGGILKGQELVENARVTATVAEFNNTAAALNTFREKYDAMPGDIPNPSVRLPGCSSAPCNVGGDGNRRVEGSLENSYVYVHMSAAGMDFGVHADGTGGVPNSVLGRPDRPRTPMGNNSIFLFAHSTNSSGNACGPLIGPTNIGTEAFLHLKTPSCASYPLTPNEAYRIDLKFDDGNPASGSVRAYSGGAQCGDANGYFENIVTPECALLVRLPVQ